MVAITRIPVSPTVLKWARRTAGLDVETAATRVGVAPRRVLDWETGESDPTINQLRALADAYQRPLGALFLKEPVSDEVLPRLPDFRRAGTRDDIDPRVLQKAIMRAHRQRDALREIAGELEFPVDPGYLLEKDVDPEQSGSVLRRALKIEAISDAVILQSEAYLRALVRAAERLNVTVVQVPRVDVDVMRGFSLGDGPCPIIALNAGDWPRGKIFTLLHELAHVGFRSSGLKMLES